MKASILTIGDELLIGQVLNSNTQWISQHLTDIGVTVTQQLSVGDVEQDIFNALDFLLRSNDILVISGGLGPTHDDITLSCLSHYFKLPLEMDLEWLEKIEAFFHSRNRPMANNNKKQALLLKTGLRIDNDCGTAAGQHIRVQSNDKTIDIFVVPGVPFEAKSMCERYIFPLLTKKSSQTGVKILKQTLLTTGVGESTLAERLDPFVKKIQSSPGATLAFLPSSTQVRLRLQFTSRSIQDDNQFQSWIEELKTRCGNDFFGFDPLTLERLIIDELKKRHETLACAESCTGGFLANQITQVPGSSQVFSGSLVTYQSKLKDMELNISQKICDELGVVSETVATMMAEAIRARWGSTYGIGITGYLGESDSDAFAAAGTVWIALAAENKTIARCFQLKGDRLRGKERATQAALDLLRRHLISA